MAEKKLPKGIRKNGNRYQGRIMFQGKNYSVTGATAVSYTHLTLPTN